MWNKTRRDRAAVGANGWRMNRSDGGPAGLVIEFNFILDASVSDAIAVLPPCAPNQGRMAYAKRVDIGNTTWDCEVVPDSTLDTIEGAPSYPLDNQYDGILLLAGADNTWLIMAATP